jgi:penicillin amidase
LPIKSLPNIYNPAKGFWATANENLVPFNYDHRDAVGWVWADTYRADRINEVLGSGRKHSLLDMMRLQSDYVSLPARRLVPFLKDLNFDDSKTDAARNLLLNWNYSLDKNSIEAGIYVAWEKRISKNALALLVPENVKKYIKYLPLSKVVDWITVTRPEFGAEPIAGRNQFLISAFQQAVDSLSKKLGPDMKKWQYGQTAYHHALIKHPLSNALDVETRKKFNVGPAPRGGYSSTPGMTTSSDNQTSGASFRIAVDLKDWDLSMFTNSPGQSGNPDSPFYKNLFPLWANDQHFPVYFSRDKIENSAAERLTLQPK